MRFLALRVVQILGVSPGCYDFASGLLDDVELKQERDDFNREYSGKELARLLPDDVKGEWFDKMTPWRATLLCSLGELSDKRILLVGNGETTREMYFAMAGANVIYTDLSLSNFMPSTRSTCHFLMIVWT